MSQDFDELATKLPGIAEIVNKFDSPALQERVFDALIASVGISTPSATPQAAARNRTKSTKARSGAASGAADARPSRKGKKVGSPSIVKDLNLRPTKGQSFADFAEEKIPGSTPNTERSLVAVYYLEKVSSVTEIGVDHVYTAYKEAKWPLPSNLGNQLQVVASTKGWLDTSNMSSVTTTVIGENYVEHSLPRQKAK
jgi:hypothetical protein